MSSLSKLAEGLRFAFAGYLFRHESKRAITGSGSPLLSALGTKILSKQLEIGTLRGFCQGVYRAKSEYLEGLPGYWTGQAARAEMDFSRTTGTMTIPDWDKNTLLAISAALQANYQRAYNASCN